METQSGEMLRANRANKAGEIRVKAEKKFTGLASDSREVKPGYLFAALSGAKTDGARFIEDAARRGAVAVLAHPEFSVQVRSLGLEFLPDENPRLRLAHLAAEFFGPQPSTIAAVTGTNGKTSVTVFLRQIWEFAGHRSASLGTIGLVTRAADVPLKHTTPDQIEMHRLLAQLKKDGVNHLVFEASSHGLDQYRIDGVEISAAAITNITRDHLDYHKSFEGYLAAKLRLFSELVRDGGVAVVNADALHTDAFMEAGRRRDLNLLTVGARGDYLKLVAVEPEQIGQRLRILHNGRQYNLHLPLAGRFQTSNALVAAGLALGLGEADEKVFAALAHLRGAPGRLEKVAYAASGAPIYVDYAHTPDALETVLTALRPHARGRLHLVFGCGGDRDRGKRPLMGKAAARFADVVIVTDDNPRSEIAADIRKEALVACPDAKEIGDRAAAIHTGIAGLAGGDILVIAGKGHEQGQIVGNETRPFSDREEAVKAAMALGGRFAEEP